MTLTQQIAKHVRDVNFGGNWTVVSLKDALTGVTWEQAVKKVDSLNTIAALVFHINYYVNPILRVLEGNPINAHDKFSFDVAPINSAEDWNALITKSQTEAEQLAKAIEQFDENKLFETFVNEKYGNYLRNFLGVIEHTHYHLGQIVLIKKMLNSQAG